MPNTEREEKNVRKKGRVFVKDGHPVGFFLNPNIKGHGQREQLRANIEAYGGRVVNEDVDADTVLVDPKFTERESLQRCYDASNDSRQRKIYVETTPFVQRCIRYGFCHALPVRKGMGGQVGRKRIPFTKEDDMYLCQSLARLMPDKNAGGRQGLKIYESLMSMAEMMPREYAWAKRHTVESWKERYKKMAEIFDPLIEEIARKEKTLEKQLWREDRRVSGKKRREVEGEGEEDDDDGEEGKNKEEEEEEENEEGDVIEIMEEAQEEMEDDMDCEWVGQELFEPGQWENDEDTQGSHEQESFEENALDEQRAVVDSSDRTKRRKSEHNPTAAKTVKRKRSEQDNDSPVQQARNKGKRRSYEQEKGDEEVHNTNGNDGVPFEEFEYFDVDEPGPSNTLRSPDRTLPEPLSSSRMAHTTSLTQETLVNPTNSHQMEAFEPLSQSTSANRRHSGNTTQSRFLSHEVREQSPVISPSPSPHPPAQHSGNMVFEIDPTSGMVLDVLPPPTLEAANPQIAARSPTQVRRGPKPRPVGKQLLSTARAGYDPPYRNTRSRFRSVEPVAFREPKPRLKTKKKKEVIPEEVKVEEVPLEIPRDSAPVTETIKEEMDVENLLKVDESNQSVQAPARELSLETDDAQTRQDLHSALRAGPLAGITFMSNRVKASDVLRKYAESTGSSRRFSVPPAQRPVVPLDSKNTRPRHTEPQGGRPRQHITNITTGTSGAGFKDLEPRTTVQVPHLRGSSMSSTEPFPLRGTRARAKKRERQEIEKHSPYKPPQGSRAAQFAGSR